MCNTFEVYYSKEKGSNLSLDLTTAISNLVSTLMVESEKNHSAIV